jgi:hypothetical protein
MSCAPDVPSTSAQDLEIKAFMYFAGAVLQGMNRIAHDSLSDA